MEPKFITQMFTEFRNRFSPRDSIEEIVSYLRQQRVPGKIEIVLPGNGGITSIEFVERRKTIEEKNPS